MTIGYPAYTRSGDALVYHRLTGAYGATIADVVAYRDAGFVLEPFATRNEFGGDANLYGLDAIDVAAGDDNLVFCSLFSPLRHPRFRSPGVVFRLQDLIALKQPVCVRPADLQTYYNAFLVQSGLDDGVRQIERDSDSLYDYADALSPLGDILYAIRTQIEVCDPHHALRLLKANTPPRREHINLAAAARHALRLLEDYDYVFRVDEADEVDWDRWEALFEQAAQNAIETGLEAWRSPAQTPELCIEGSLPLSAAVAAFDNDTLHIFSPDTADLGSLKQQRSLPASAIGNRT